LFWLVALGSGHGQTASEVAESVERPEGAPRLSDVSMRLFRKKKGGEELAVAKAFHITRADWSYIRDPKYIKMVHDLGWAFQGTVNAVTYNADHAMQTQNGEPMLDHFSKPGRYWADMENASYRQWYLDQLTEWTELGVDSVQRDEPTTCRRTAVSVAARFFEQMHAEYEARPGCRIPMSCNLASFDSVFGGKGDAVSKLFDFGMAEMGPDKVKPGFFLHASRDTRRRGKAMVFTACRDLGVPKYRLSIAACYATGMTFIVPWDQYAGVKNPRVFSRPEDLADLYGFVRANARHLDRYEDVAAIGYGVENSHWGPGPALSIEGSDRVSVFVRAMPGDAAASVIAHLIDWGTPGPFKVKFRSAAFFASGGVTAALKVPPPYDVRLHEHAEESKDYASLSRDMALRATTEGDWTAVEIPALEPWGMLVLSRKTTPNEPDTSR